VVGKLTGGLTAMAKMRKVTMVRGVWRLPRPEPPEGRGNHRHAQEKTGKKQTIRFKNAIIAAGSQAVRLPFMPQDERAWSIPPARSNWPPVPKRMLILGGGIIGLEMGTVYSTLGARLDVVEMLDGLMQGADRDLVRVWQKMNAPRFDNIMLKTKTVGAEATKDGILVRFEGEQAPKEPQLYDLVLQAVGRSPNGKKIGAEKAGVTVTDRGFIPVDIQMRTNVPHIFAIGDIVGQPMLAHKAVHEAHVAAEAPPGEKVAFNARVIPSVAYTDPEVAWVGPHRGPGQGRRHRDQEGALPLDGFGPRHRQRARRRLHQAAVRRRDAPHPGRRHRRHACRRHDRRGRAGHRDGRRRDGHRQDHPPAPDAGRKHRHGRRDRARHLHRRAAGEEGGLIGIARTFPDLTFPDRPDSQVGTILHRG
jgi:dihydrolipoamide dehydrogenase